MGPKVLLAIALVALRFSSINGDCNPDDFKAAMISDTKDQNMKAICSIPDNKKDKLPTCLKDGLAKYSIKEIKDEATGILETINKINDINTVDNLGDKLHKESPELSQLFDCTKDETIKFVEQKADEIMEKIQLPQTKEFLKNMKKEVKETAVETADKIKKMWKDLEPSVKQDMVDALSFSFATMQKVFSNKKFKKCSILNPHHLKYAAGFMEKIKL